MSQSIGPAEASGVRSFAPYTPYQLALREYVPPRGFWMPGERDRLMQAWEAYQRRRPPIRWRLPDLDRTSPSDVARVGTRGALAWARRFVYEELVSAGLQVLSDQVSEAVAQEAAAQPAGDPEWLVQEGTDFVYGAAWVETYRDTSVWPLEAVSTWNVFTYDPAFRVNVRSDPGDVIPLSDTFRTSVTSPGPYVSGYSNPLWVGGFHTGRLVAQWFNASGTPDTVGLATQALPLGEPGRVTAMPSVTSWALAGARMSSPYAQGYQASYAAPEAYAEPAPHWAKPKRQVKVRNRRPERKLKMPLYKRVLFVWALEQITEASDLLGAVYKALPQEVRRACRQRWVEGEFARGVRRPAKVPPASVQAACIRDNWRFLDAEGVYREVVWESLSDLLVGAVGQAVASASAGIHRRSAPIINPQHFEGADQERVRNALSPNLPTQGLEAWVTGRAARERRQSRDQAVRDFAIDEGIRRRRNRQAEIARRKAYRQGIT